MIEQIALPDWDFVTELSREQEIRILEVLFDLLDKFLAERESLAQHPLMAAGRAERADQRETSEDQPTVGI